MKHPERIPICWKCANGIQGPVNGRDGVELIHADSGVKATTIVGCKANDKIKSLIDAQTLCPILNRECDAIEQDKTTDSDR